LPTRHFLAGKFSYSYSTSGFFIFFNGGTGKHPDPNQPVYRLSALIGLFFYGFRRSLGIGIIAQFGIGSANDPKFLAINMRFHG
jgi:hypothetical protein